MLRCVEKTNEEKVTKILSANEILTSGKSFSMSQISKFNLGNFLKKQKQAPGRFGERYKFVK